MGVGTGHEASCGCAMCAAKCEHDEHRGAGEHADKANALAGYGVPNGGIGDALVGGRIWATNELTFGFPAEAEGYDQNAFMAGIQYGEGEPTEGFAALTADQRQAAEFAVAQIAAVTELTFTRDDADADIRIAQSGVPASAWAYYPDREAHGGDVWFGNARGYYDDPARGSYGWHAFLHELGHSVGLKHGHDHGVIGAGGALEADRDTMEWSVMTYRSYVGDPMENGYSNETAGFAQSLMRVDIAALQQLYGANYDHQSGDTHYAWDPETGELRIDGAGRGASVANRIFETIWDGGGEDVIDASAYQTDISIDLAPGAGSVLSDDQLAFLNRKDGGNDAIYASANVYLAELHEDDVRALIENAIGGSGDDQLFGNSANNKLSGGAGADLIRGLAGSDIALGGGGDDSLLGGGGKDRLAGQGGADQLSGGNGGDRLAGGGGRDELDGGRGRDKLIGGGGADELTGGRGADHLVGGGGADVFRFAKGDGPDRIMDFNAAQDQIDLSQLRTDFEALRIADTVGGARIKADGVSILLVRNEADEMTADQFIF